MTHLFVTSSGTDIGKTVVSSIIIRQLRERGLDVDALKPVVSGVEGVDWKDTDTGQLIEALGQEINDASIARMSPWRFDPPLSPDMAADRVGVSLDLQELTDYCLSPKNKHVVLVEGAGGVLVPINERANMADWMSAIKARTELKVLLVVGSYLGTISHTLTAMESLKARGLGPDAIVISTSETNPVPVEETVEVMSRFANGVPIVVVPRLDDTNPDIPDLTRLVL